eukprot:TRINITY_DN2543_c0_g2_i2.p1 TRINITY_DN2543_c0_g2~~TRINITY_DN2543_c0_g2_i2.p1  ORF type:complete len:749 (-),score=207.74 TRINITY_DN2543_c0_g2_i2:489-2735(-)
MKVDSNGIVVRGAIGYSAAPLHTTDKDKKPETRVLAYTPPATARGVASKPRTITLRFTRLISPPGPKNELSSEWYGFMTCLLADALEDGGLTKIGGAFFDLNDEGKGHVMEGLDGDGVTLLTGLKVSLHPTDRSGLMLAVDIATRVTRNGTVLDVLREAERGMKGAESQQRAKQAHVEGVMCVATYTTGNRRQTVRADKIRFDMTPRTLMALPPGAAPNTKRQTYAEYMNTVHGVPMRDIDMNQPLIEHTSKKQVDVDGKPKVFHYIPQMLRIASQSQAVRDDTELQKRIKKIALMSSELRFNTIGQWMTQLTTNGMFHRLRQHWKVNVKDAFVQAPARILPPPELFSGGERPRQIPISGSSQWLVRSGMQLPIKGPVPKAWTVVYPQSIADKTSQFVAMMMDNTINGLKAGWPQPIKLSYQSGHNDVQNMKVLRETVLPNIDAEAEFVLFVLPNDSETFYHAVKTETLQAWKVPSQCVLFKNVVNERNHLNVSSRVGGQMLVKSGSELWTQTGKDVPNSLVCGVTATKCGDGVVLAVVAQRGDDFRFVYEGSRVTRPGPSMGRAVCEMITEASTVYHTQSKAMKLSPLTSVIVYRSGLDEGSVSDVSLHEVVPLRELCTERKWKLCVVSSLKRCLTRFYKPAIGTVVDRAVLPKTGHTFLMVAHHANVGTATAMKYTVLANDVPALQRSGDVVQSLTFKLCHMFFGWWGATREPSVVMYAQRHADLCAGLKAPREGIVIKKGCYSSL